MKPAELQALAPFMHRVTLSVGRLVQLIERHPIGQEEAEACLEAAGAMMALSAQLLPPGVAPPPGIGRMLASMQESLPRPGLTPEEAVMPLIEYHRVTTRWRSRAGRFGRRS